MKWICDLLFNNCKTESKLPDFSQLFPVMDIEESMYEIVTLRKLFLLYRKIVQVNQKPFFNL